MSVLDEKRVTAWYAAAKADRWALPMERFRQALEASVERAFPEAAARAREVEKHVASLHLEDLALACACAEGHDAAWELVIREYRPVLYRAADALDATGGARELADAVYGELYERSLFRYFHGRSSLATWLRSVLAQRYVDRLRSVRRLEPLPEDEGMLSASVPQDPDAARCGPLIERTLRAAIAALPPRDRLRLRCYYAQQLTLAQTGRVLKEHEATVSRQLARTRAALRREVERGLRDAGLAEDAIERCFELSSQDAGALDLDRIFAGPARKISEPDRSEGG